jgi:hypothetical protein
MTTSLAFSAVLEISIFLRYVLKIDAGRISIPSIPIYQQMRMARKQIECMIQCRRQSPGALAPTDVPQGQPKSHTTARRTTASQIAMLRKGQDRP